MQAQFRKRIQNGEIPKQAVRISFRKHGDVYFPYEDTIVYSQHFSRVLHYDNSESSFVDYTYAAAENDALVFSGGTLALNDYLYFGLPARFSSIYFDVSVVNAVAAVSAMELWNGTAWTSTKFSDLTSSGGATLAQDGVMSWPMPNEDDWQTTEVSGHEYFWIRISADAGLTAGCRISEIKIAQADWGYKIYNKCLTSIGQHNLEFQLDPINYGQTIGNLSLSFVNNDLMAELWYQENWKSAWVQVLEYFASYEAGDEEDVVVAGKKLIAAYNFGNTDQNLMRVKFFGIIKDHPAISESSISCTLESWQQFYGRMKIPQYIINSSDWQRCPKSNLGRPGQIIVGNQTTDKTLILVDEGASAVLDEKPGGGDYTETDTLLYFDDLSTWGETNNPLVIMIDREKMLVESVDIQQNTITIAQRQFANTSAATLEDGRQAFEYKPKERWMVANRTIAANQIGDGYAVDIVAINPDDDREQFVIPPEWYSVVENDTSKTGSPTLTWIATDRPLLGYFPSTENNQLEIKSTQNNQEPWQSLEPGSGLTKAIGEVSLTGTIAINLLQYKYFTANVPAFTLIKNTNDGWIYPLSAISSGSAQFYGQSSWNSQGLRWASLVFQQTSQWGETGNIFSGIGDMGVSLRYSVSVGSPTTPALRFFYRPNWRAPTTMAEELAYYLYMTNSDLNTSPGSQPYITDFLNSNNQVYYSATAWEDFTTRLIEMHIADTRSSNMYSYDPGDPHDWASARCSLSSISYQIRARANSWSSTNLANICDGNDATSETANGFLPNGMAIEGPYYDQTVLFEVTIAGGITWPAQPGGTSIVTEAKIRIVYEHAFYTFDNNDTVTLTWDEENYHGGNPVNKTFDLRQYNQSGAKSVVYLDIPLSYNIDNWERNYIRIKTRLKKHAAAPLTIYRISLHITYDTATGVDTGKLWTDDEDFPLGYYCFDLGSDGPQSYAWLTYKSVWPLTTGGEFPGNYANQDGMLAAYVSPEDLGYGLITSVKIMLTHQINPRRTNPATGQDWGGCVHKVGDEYYNAAWTWYGHLGMTNSAYTGEDGVLVNGDLTFTDANVDFEALGVRGKVDVDTDTLPDILYIGSGTSQGTYVIDSVTDATHLEIEPLETRKWDISKNTFATDGSSIVANTDLQYKIFRPFELKQTGDILTEEFDITSQQDTWSPETDIANQIYIRGKLYDDFDPSVSTDYDYYDNDLNPSLFRLWMPKLKLIYNDGKEAIITARYLSGIDSGTENPAVALDDLLQNEVGIDSDLIDTDSYNTVVGNLETGIVKKIDWNIDQQITVDDLIRRMSYPFGYAVTFDERIKWRDGSSPLVYDGSILTGDTQIRSYGATTQWDDHNYAQGGHSASPNAESNATTGWTIRAGDTLSSVADPRTGSDGSYSIKGLNAAGSDMYIQFALTSGLIRTNDYRVTFWAKGSTAQTLYIQIGGTHLRTAGAISDLKQITLGTGWKRYSITVSDDPSKRIDTFRLTLGEGVGANEYWQIDDLIFERQIDLAETTQRQIRVVNPIRVMSIEAVDKWGPMFTEVKLAYDLKPWFSTKDNFSFTRRSGYQFLTSYGDPYYDNLITDYGSIPYPDPLQTLPMISDSATAKAHYGWLQRFGSQKFILSVNLGQFAAQLELGDVLYFGIHNRMPQHYAGEYLVDKYFQVLSRSGSVVKLIEVNSNFGDCIL